MNSIIKLRNIYAFNQNIFRLNKCLTNYSNIRFETNDSKNKFNENDLNLLVNKIRNSQKQLIQDEMHRLVVWSHRSDNSLMDELIEVLYELKQKQLLNEELLSFAKEITLKYCKDIDVYRKCLKRFGEQNQLSIHYFWPILTKCQTERQLLDVLSHDIKQSYFDSKTLKQTFVDYIWPKNFILDKFKFMFDCKRLGFPYNLTAYSLFEYCLNTNSYEELCELIESKEFNSHVFQLTDNLEELCKSFYRKPEAKKVAKILVSYERKYISKYRNPLRIPDICGKFLHHFVGLYPNSDDLLSDLLMAFVEERLRVSMYALSAIAQRIQLNKQMIELISRLEITELELDFYYLESSRDEGLVGPPFRLNEYQEWQLLYDRRENCDVRQLVSNLFVHYCRRTRLFDECEDNVCIKLTQNRIKELLSEMRENKYVFDNSMKAHLMEYYISCNDLDKAFRIYSEIGSKYVLNNFQVFNLAHLMLKNGLKDEMFGLIFEQISKKLKFYFSSEIAYRRANGYKRFNVSHEIRLSVLLNCFIDLYPNETKELKDLFNLCIDFSSMKVTTRLAEPLIRIHVLNNDYSEALKLFVNFAKFYRLIAYKLQLMQIFVLNSDEKSLQTLITSSELIQSDDKTIVDLSAVYCLTGNVSQAEALMSAKPNLDISREQIEYLCDYFKIIDKFDELLNFISLLKYIPHINRQKLFRDLIIIYHSNDCIEKIYNVLNVMNKQEIVFTNETKKILDKIEKINSIKLNY